MKQLASLLLLIAVMAVSCWEQQWEERLERGDTGIVTHGDPAKDTADYSPEEVYYGNCTGNSITHSVAGRVLFKKHCQGCHSTNDRRDYLIGLYHVKYRVPDTAWLYAFIRDEKAMVQKGDAYTLKLRKEHEEYNEYYHNFDLNRKQIDLILGK